MKSIKVFYHGKRLKDIYPYATKWEVFKFKTMRFFRQLVIATVSISVLTGMVYGSFKIGQSFSPVQTVYAEKTVEVPVESEAPVLDRIANCESQNSHIDKNGQVLVRANDNKSIDVGVMQINMKIWGKKATEMGYNLMVEKDNRAFARFLYAQYGTEPWVWSKSCWNK